MNKVLKAAWFATKIGIGGGVVYVTVDQGIWGSSHHSTAAYERLFDIMPGTKSVSEKYLQLPKKDDVNVNFRSYWNSGVFYTFDFIANIPSKVGNLKDYIVDFASSPHVDKKENEAPSKTEETTPVSSEAAETPPAAPEASSEEKPPAEETK
ncbi:MICOS complex subunit MIC13-like [Portunus trituberculatus]|uniref:MICOS complex subunit MIC13-like n=1 Tax=Portunus trituberculatus TaxID=210409 RepID=UPI001E1D0E86|nr:MICOS complex subunit MIC13-like [Portunus trituberculatus]